MEAPRIDPNCGAGSSQFFNLTWPYLSLLAEPYLTLRRLPGTQPALGHLPQASTGFHSLPYTFRTPSESWAALTVRLRGSYCVALTGENRSHGAPSRSGHTPYPPTLGFLPPEGPGGDFWLQS